MPRDYMNHSDNVFVLCCSRDVDLMDAGLLRVLTRSVAPAAEIAVRNIIYNMGLNPDANRGVPMKAYFTNGTSSEVRRFTVDEDVSTNVEYLFEKLRSIFPSLRFKPFRVSWKGDDVLISSDGELMEALSEYAQTRNFSDSNVPALPFKLCVMTAERRNFEASDAAAGLFVIPENILNISLTAFGLKKDEHKGNANEDAKEFCCKQFRFGKHHHHGNKGHNHCGSHPSRHSRHGACCLKRHSCHHRGSTSDAYDDSEDQAHAFDAYVEHWHRAWRSIMNSVAGRRGACWQETMQEMIPTMLSAGFNLNQLMETLTANGCGLAEATSKNGADGASGETNVGGGASSSASDPQKREQRSENEPRSHSSQQGDVPLFNNLFDFMKMFNLNPNENASMKDVMGLFGDFIGNVEREHGSRDHCHGGNPAFMRTRRYGNKGASGGSENPQVPTKNAKTTDAASSEGNHEAPYPKTSGVVVDVDIDDGVSNNSGNASGEKSAEQSPGAVAAEWTM
ncbi:unnamed protein product, partial [Notodromas monacha]